MSTRAPSSWKWHLLACAIFGVLTVVHTWPMAVDPAGQSLHWNHDAIQITWIVNWVADHVWTAPLEVLDANIFHPAPRALTYSDPMLVTGALGAPLRALGAGPVLTHNLLWLAGFALSGFAMYLLVHAYTGDFLAALAAGTLFIFNSHVFSRAPHLMAIHKEWLPLALLAMERLVDDTRARTAVVLGLLVAAAALSSGHLVLYTLLLLSGILVGRFPAWRPRWKAFLPSLGLAAAVALLVVVPILHPWIVEDRGRDPGALTGVAEPVSYLSSLARVHYGTWSGRFYRQGPAVFTVFPGIAAMLLAAYGSWRALSRPRPEWSGRVPAYLFAAGLGVILSLGPATPVYGWARAAFPPLAAVRAPGRFAFVFLTAVAVLAGLGLAAARRSSRGRFAGLLAPLIFLAIINVEAFVAPLPVQEWKGVDPLYRSIAGLPDDTVLAELPVKPRPPFHDQTVYMLHSTAHWKPIVNGYASFFPVDFRDHMRHLAAFPDASAVRRLLALGVTHVVVHFSEYDRGFRRRLRGQLREMSAFRRVGGDDEGAVLYRLRERAAKRWLQRTERPPR